MIGGRDLVGESYSVPRILHGQALQSLLKGAVGVRACRAARASSFQQTRTHYARRLGNATLPLQRVSLATSTLRRLTQLPLVSPSISKAGYV
ncbi:hypothetical protein NDU88_002797 [Pleurodeles waltl]|uniref:Uncharacterized protein n=1 Tax=Pleurodeles waltl TaxID=8319 RepID=A0AAV7UAP2_PLEWA|nr:hypothetical protein NDU88_002797 [Pleurodeles waltl]